MSTKTSYRPAAVPTPMTMLLLPSMSMPQIPAFPKTMFIDFEESGLVLKARPM
jgi:hypothetical protein